LQTTRRNRTVRSWGIKGRYECMEVKVLLPYHTFATRERSYELGIGDCETRKFCNIINRLMDINRVAEDAPALLDKPEKRIL